MFDTMTMTKILGAFCGAFLVFLLVGWGADMLYTTNCDVHEDDHGHAGCSQSYSIAVSDVDEGPAEEGPDFATLMLAAVPDQGARSFRRCQACHALEEGAHGTGPSLFGVVGRDIASAAGFEFSGTLTGIEGDWTPEALSGFIENPRNFAPGTAMSFAGIPDAEDRANLIAFLMTFQ